MSQTILRFTSGNSNKIWAYSPEHEKSYYGRFGSRLRSVDLSVSKSFSRIQEKLNKGYEDVSSSYYVEKDGTLRNGSLQNTTGDEWTISFDSSIARRDAIFWLEFLHLNDSFSKERDSLCNQLKSVASATEIVKKPSPMGIGLLAGLKHKFPTIVVVAEDGETLSKSQLIKLAGMSKEDMVQLELIKEIKLFNSTIASDLDQDAYF